MLNFLWAGMILAGILFAAFTGRIPQITNAAIDSSKEAITLCVTMMGVMALWVGLMEIAQKAGIMDALSARLRPMIRFLFPGLPAGHPAEPHILTNLIANFLGLGWAATPAGLRPWRNWPAWRKTAGPGGCRDQRENGAWPATRCVRSLL